MTRISRDTAIRPQLRRDTVLHRLDSAALLLTGDDTVRLVGGDAYRLLARLCPHLTGERTLHEICAGLPSTQRDTVYALISGLAERGVVIDAGRRTEAEPEPIFRDQYEYLAHTTAAPASGFRRWRTSRILLLGNGVSLHAAATVLLRNGAGQVSIAPDQGWPFRSALEAAAGPAGAGARIELHVDASVPEPGDHDAVLYCADRVEPATVTDLIHASRAGGPPLLAAAVADGWAVLAPVTQSSNAGCWWCAVNQLDLDPGRPADGSGALTSTVARMLGGALAFDAFRLLAGAQPEDPTRGAVVQWLRTLEATRLPTSGGCPICQEGSSAATGTRPRPAVGMTTPTLVRTVPDLPATNVEQYAAAVYRLVQKRLAPARFTPDWADRPAGHTPHPNAMLIPLPEYTPPVQRPYGSVLRKLGARYTLPALAWLLRMSYGLLSRRLRVDSARSDAHGDYSTASWRRGAISGGGLYPLEIYWVAGEGGPLPAGIYHYAPGHHALERLTLGDASAPVRRAVRHPAAENTDQFLLISLRFWRNAFKYANLAYHIGTLDVGALLGTLDQLGAALGLPTRRLMWFDDQALNDVVGVDTAEESVLAVVPMPWEYQPAPFEPAAAGDPVTRWPAAYERSRTVLRFACTQQVHRTTILDGQPRPEPNGWPWPMPEPGPAAGHPAGALVVLPEPAQLPQETVGDLLRRRRSSFGGLVATPPLGLDALGAMLRMTTRASGYRSDVTADDKPSGWTRLSVLANHVVGLAPGGYRYDSATHVLHRVDLAGSAAGWPDLLARIGRDLTNYDLGQTAAVLVVSGRPDTMASGYGPRGYRLLNAEVGTVAQNVYLAATALGIGCGAVLNLDHPTVGEVLGFNGTDERPVLCLLIGGERVGSPDFDHPLC